MWILAVLLIQSTCVLASICLPAGLPATNFCCILFGVRCSFVCRDGLRLLARRGIRCSQSYTGQFAPCDLLDCPCRIHAMPVSWTAMVSCFSCVHQIEISSAQAPIKLSSTLANILKHSVKRWPPSSPNVDHSASHFSFLPFHFPFVAAFSINDAPSWHFNTGYNIIQ